MATVLFETETTTVTQCSNGEGKGTRLEITLAGYAKPLVIDDPEIGDRMGREYYQIGMALAKWAFGEAGRRA